ncbi:hypothetical protein [Enterobacter sp. UPMP2052]
MLSPTKKALALKLHQERNHTIEEICNMMGISKSKLYNYLSKAIKDATGMALEHSCRSIITVASAAGTVIAHKF